jgi:hypothetical protein
MGRSSGKQIIEDIQKDLFSPEEPVILDALQRCRDEGNASLILPLIMIYLDTPHHAVKQEAAEILRSLKIEGAEEAMMSAVLDPKFQAVRKDLISFMWNAGLQPIGWMSDITRIAVDGGLEETIECLTLLETITDPIPEEHLLESVGMLRQALNANRDPDKSGLLRIYLNVLSQHEESD